MHDGPMYGVFCAIAYSDGMTIMELVVSTPSSYGRSLCKRRITLWLACSYALFS